MYGNFSSFSFLTPRSVRGSERGHYLFVFWFHFKEEPVGFICRLNSAIGLWALLVVLLLPSKASAWDNGFPGGQNPYFDAGAVIGDSDLAAAPIASACLTPQVYTPSHEYLIKLAYGKTV